MIKTSVCRFTSANMLPVLLILNGLLSGADPPYHTWMADNGNGTYSNPVFYDEFSDPDLIRVGEDYYLTGTTMHVMPGLPVLHSKDLVNWKFLSYAMDKLDLGPEFRLEDGKDAYGQGVWAPCFRYHAGQFYIFSNVNRHKTQVFRASDPAGPWSHTEMNVSLHDLSVLFDEGGKIYVVWGYDELRLAELNEDLTDIKTGTEKIIIPAGSGAGEGCHFYKIDGRYYITSTNWDPVCYQVCARADDPYGPYEICLISAQENLGIGTGYRLSYPYQEDRFEIQPPRENHVGCITLHQGGIVQTQRGEWWGFSMMDHNSVGRLTCLSPVTWYNGWPFLGLSGNLTRTPRTWVKPETGFAVVPHAPFKRGDDFSGPKLNPVWQWNHVPADEKWSLTEREGFLTLSSLPAESFWHARNTLTQRAIGPESIATVELDAARLQDGDIAGLALLNYPYAWLGISKENDQYTLRQYDQTINFTVQTEIDRSRIWLRVHCNFDNEHARFSYSLDGNTFEYIGENFIMVFQLRTFQGVRYGLFNYNTNGIEGGIAAFNGFEVTEPRSPGLTRPIPYGDTIILTCLADSTILVNWKNILRPVSRDHDLANGPAARFRIIDKGKGRIALQSESDGGYVTVTGSGLMSQVRIEKKLEGAASTFQWQDMLRGDLMLMSLQTHRFLKVEPFAASLCSADARGARPDRKGGACFSWKEGNQ